ncbi:hypothetical protein CEXT_779871 [Caerostris extrusa]|uniref:Uncharacterized protein n=1 Tax=Caerostris extrusa TaxID=172846 RepID=A0AAV4UN51_CAEEX|nr:hypothetical protein CEXT_779871 [Caerostris extrusa]
MKEIKKSSTYELKHLALCRQLPVILLRILVLSGTFWLRFFFMRFHNEVRQKAWHLVRPWQLCKSFQVVKVHYRLEETFRRTESSSSEETKNHFVEIFPLERFFVLLYQGLDFEIYADC